MSNLKRCPVCGSWRFTYRLGKDGVAVECINCGKVGEKAVTSWTADRLWNELPRKKEWDEVRA